MKEDRNDRAAGQGLTVDSTEALREHLKTMRPLPFRLHTHWQVNFDPVALTKWYSNPGLFEDPEACGPSRAPDTPRRTSHILPATHSTAREPKRPVA